MPLINAAAERGSRRFLRQIEVTRVRVRESQGATAEPETPPEEEDGGNQPPPGQGPFGPNYP